MENKEIILLIEELKQQVEECRDRDSSNYIDSLLKRTDWILKHLNVNNGVLGGVKDELTLADFRVGFNYEEHELDSERYLSKGMCWVKKTYGLNSPRLHKIDKLLKEGKLRRVNSL